MIKEIKVQTTHWICCDHDIIMTKKNPTNNNNKLRNSILKPQI
jgi:hypothetical protein